MTAQRAVEDKQDYFRLITFWVICEAFAGGIIHAIKLPFSGMIVGSFAVFCIVMIGKHFPGKGNILKATILVCIFKLMLSPHSPPTAYLAVLFQGTIGELLFRLKLPLKITAILIAFLALVESSVQRILVLWLLYGKDFWDAVGRYLEKFSQGGGAGSIPEKVALAYIGFHALFGLVAGYYFAILASGAGKNELRFSSSSPSALHELPKRKGRKKIRWFFILLWLILAALLAYGYAYPQKALLSGNSALWILFRALSILLVWYFIISPLVMKLLKRRLELSKTKQLEGFISVQNLLPSTGEIFFRSWEFSSQRKGLARVFRFLKILSANMVPQKQSG